MIEVNPPYRPVTSSSIDEATGNAGSGIRSELGTQGKSLVQIGYNFSPDDPSRREGVKARRFRAALMLDHEGLRYLVSFDALVLFATSATWIRFWLLPTIERLRLAAASSAATVAFGGVSLSVAIMATTV